MERTQLFESVLGRLVLGLEFFFVVGLSVLLLEIDISCLLQSPLQLTSRVGSRRHTIRLIDNVATFSILMRILRYFVGAVDLLLLTCCLVLVAH